MSLYSPCYSTGEIMELIEYEAKYSAPLSYINFVLALATCIIGLIGNAIVIFFNIFVIKKHKSKIWFLNLAITDFVSLLFLPLHASAVLYGHWPYGKHICKLFLFVICVNMYASIFILIALNLSRVLSVAKPMFHRKFISQHVLRWTCIMIWMITIFTSLPVLVFSGEFKIGDDSYCSLNCAKEDGDGAFDPTYNLSKSLILDKNVKLDVYNKFRYFFKECSPEECCEDENMLTTWKKILFSIQSFVIPLLVFGYFIPFCVIIFSNITIALQARKSQTVNTHRLYQIVITIIIVYFVTWTPFILGEIILLATVRNMNLIVMLKVMIFMPLLSTIAFTSCAFNPIMYVLVGKQARTGLADFFSSISIRST
ncbi:C3a anaphylatoxin chemotactic receptor-like [Rana temporaria]|uniref:C3a anaphylatoxin chemotactic receptor-like n=1 Tax=Rana temporaria TaxID=8407 RepID=UPI001AAC617D|nr:C3a anaphylatoxin chemotactic receptor-like [Rana temporaria]